MMGKTIRLKNPKVKPTTKYAIQEQVDQLPRHIKIGDLLKHLENVGISRDEYYHDRSIKFGTKQSIPGDRLTAYAKVFDCTIEDLMNHDIKAKSIRGEVSSPKTSLQ